MAFAVIETGGKQYRVSPGNVLEIEKLSEEAGTTYRFERVLLFQDGAESVVGLPFIEGAVVNAEILEQFRGPKIRVSTYKPKKRQHRTLGHRQSLTRVKIVDIVASAKAAKATN